MQSDQFKLAENIQEIVAEYMPGKPILNIERVSIILELFARHHDNGKCMCARFKGARTKTDTDCARVIKEQVQTRLTVESSNAAKLISMAYKILYDPQSSKALSIHSPSFDTSHKAD